MENRIGWIQPENTCQAYRVWNNLWDITNATKWTSDKGSIEHTPVTPGLMMPTLPQESLDSLGVQASYTVQKVCHEEMKQREIIASFNQIQINDMVAPCYYRNPEVPAVDHRNMCPLYVLEMRHVRNAAATSRANRMREEIESKRKVNKASIYGRNFYLHSNYCPHPETSLPWKPINKIYDYNIIGLHEEIKDFYDHIKPTASEHRMRQSVIDRISALVKNLWPAARVDVFGSFRTLLYLPTSDIDLVIFDAPDTAPLKELDTALRKKGIASDIKVLDRAAVPIVKMIDKETDVRVDIGFDITNSVRSATLILDFIGVFPCLPYLVFVVKQFLLQSNLNEVWTGGISSYSLILMCISFLQLHNKIDARSKSANDINLGSLLIEFFELYGRHFNYLQTGIRIMDGGSYVKKEEIQKEMDGGHRASILCIEDPLTQGNDIGRSSYGALVVKQAFEYAFIVLNQALMPQSSWIAKAGQPHSILSRIIHVTSDVIDYRQWIERTHGVVAGPSDSKSCESEAEDPGEPIPEPVATFYQFVRPEDCTVVPLTVSLKPEEAMPVFAADERDSKRNPRRRIPNGKRA